MKKPIISLGLLTLLGLASACSYHRRDPDTYRNDTAALLAKQSDEIKSCYDAPLASDAKLGGNVTVEFKVEKKTGKLVDAKVVPAKTSAPASIQSCVTGALGGLALDPADAQDGLATFTWEFTATQAAPAAAPPPAKPKG